MKKKANYKKFLELNNLLKIIPVTKKDRLTMAVIEFESKLKYAREKYTRDRERILQETASLDENGNYFLDKNNNPDYNKINKEGLQNRDRQLLELLNKEIDIEPVITADLRRIKDLPLEIIQLYNGWIWDLSKEKIEEIFLEEPQNTTENGITA